MEMKTRATFSFSILIQEVNMSEAIQTDKAPAAIGPYAQARQQGAWIFTSGQIGLDPANAQMVADDVVLQTRQVLANLEAVLNAAQASRDHVVKTTIFLTDMGDFAAVNREYEAFFGEHKPARSTIAVSQLPKDARVEIEAIAHL